MTPRAASTIAAGPWPGVVVLLVALVAGAPHGAAAATIVHATDAQMVARAARIVHAEVRGVSAHQDADGIIHTTTALEILEDFTGIRGERLAVVELGGRVGDQALVVPGVPRFAVGDEVVLLLEPGSHGGWRTVALSYGRFSVAVGAEGRQDAARLVRQDDEGLLVVGRPVAESAPLTIAGFRQLVAAVKGSTPVRSSDRPAPEVRLETFADDDVRAASEAAITGFTLLGGGLRWTEADRGVPVLWYRNLDAVPPVAGDADALITQALGAWTVPGTSSIDLRFAGARSAGARSVFCGTAHAGAGLVSFEDPTGQMPSYVLALGGGCVAPTASRTVNGVAFQSFSHGFVVLNRADALGATYRTSLNLTRILQHEVGHAIGLGHTDLSTPQAASNIMYPTCCSSAMPTPPALGPGDLAGLAFIYPLVIAPVCSYSVSPLAAAFPRSGGIAQVSVNTASDCGWSVESLASWIQPGGAAARQGSATIGYVVPRNPGPPRSGELRVAGEVIRITQSGDDSDGDGLPDEWEARFGLDPGSSAGADGAQGDPDADAATNAQELAAGSHPRGFERRLFAEGATGDFFETWLVVFNPDESRVARVLARGFSAGGVQASVAFELAPGARRTVRPAADFGFAREEFAAMVEADGPVVADRTMRWAGADGAAHAETAVEAAASQWYFAEGATHSGFDLFFLLSNVEAAPVDVTVRYLRPAPAPPIERVYRVGARSRQTIWVDVEDPALESADVAATISVADGRTIVAERAMYLSRKGRTFMAGHGGVGARSPALRWWFAEGATGAFFDTYLLVANPGPSEAALLVRYLLPSGEQVVVPHRAAAGARTTIWVDEDHARVGDTALAIDVTSSNGVPVVVERAMWWPGPTAAAWTEAHVTAGMTATSPRWATADLEVRRDTPNAAAFLLVANTSDAPGLVRVVLACEEWGGTRRARSFSVAATGRLNVDIGVEFPEAVGQHCSAVIAAQEPPDLALVVERATYWGAGGSPWTAGTVSAASPLGIRR